MFIISYMTPIHWLVFMVIFVITCLLLALVVIKLKGILQKFFIVTILFVSLVTMSNVLLKLDKKLKHASLNNFSFYRDYKKGTITLTGNVQNGGKYKLARVILHVNVKERSKIVFQKITFFKNSSLKRQKRKKKFELDRKIVVAEELIPGDSVHFSKTVIFQAVIKNMVVNKNLIVY